LKLKAEAKRKLVKKRKRWIEKRTVVELKVMCKE
jgi:hypothetical protein